MECIQWLFGEFIPFGDLASDVALVLTLPSSDDYDSEDVYLYRDMRWLLWVGTLISSIPLVALLAGISTGLVVGVTLGPASLATGGKGMDTLLANGQSTAVLPRYLLSESKTITRFILRLTKDAPHEWGNMPTLAVRYVLFVPLLPIAYPLMKLWGLGKSRCAATVEVNAPITSRDLESAHRTGTEERPEPWYAPLVFVQVVAGLMTEISSIFFAVSTGNSVSIASAVFGLYCLSVSTLVAILEGPQSRSQAQSAPAHAREPRQEVCSDSCKTFLKEAGVKVGGMLLSVLFIGFCGALLSLPLLGAYFLETGDQYNGRILASVGSICVCVFVLAVIWILLRDDEEYLAVVFAFFVNGIQLIGLGIVFTITQTTAAGITLLVIGVLFSVASGTAWCRY